MIKKCFFILLGVLLVMASPAFAGFSIPKNVYKISNMDKACETALKENKPLTFLYSDKETTCILCTRASNDILYSLDKMSIIVYAQQSDWEKLPSLVQSVLLSPSSGKYIPKTVIVNPQIDTIIDVIPYQDQNRIVVINEAKKKIAKHFGLRNWE